MTATPSLSRRVATAFYKNFGQLKEAQQAAIIPLLTGRNVVISSGTGSGKTEAAVAPMVDRYWKEAVEKDGLFLLYIAPTKALANDLKRRLDDPLRELDLRVGVRHGDRDDLKSTRPPNILITTPESLEVLIIRKDAALKDVRAVIIDEVHLLYNTQRGLQLSVLLRRLEIRLQIPLQWAALSATIGRLENVCKFLFGVQAEAVYIQASASRTIDAKIIAIENLTEFQTLIQKLTSHPPKKLLLFANSRRECEQLVGELQNIEALRGAVYAHYSSLSAEVRVEIETLFTDSKTAVCIATSTLELGIDIGNIDAVLLWGTPASLESFLQRIGRSNRRSAKTNVICLIPPQADGVVAEVLRFLVLLQESKAGTMPIREPYSLYGAVGQQCLSMIYAGEQWFTRIAELCEAFSHIDYLDRPTIEMILAELAHNEYIKPHGFQHRYGPAENLNKLVDYRQIYGNFGASSQEIEVKHDDKLLGVIPAINLLRISAGNNARFAGKCWRIRKASREGILLEPIASTPHALDFTYGGKKANPDAFITDRVWKMLHNNTLPIDILHSALRLPLTEMQNRLKSACNEYQIPCKRSLEGYGYTTYAGYMVNKAIALFTNQSGYLAEDTMLLVSKPIEWNSLPDSPQDYETIFPSLFETSGEQSIYQTLLPYELQRTEFIQTWIQDNTVREILARLSRSETFYTDQTIGL